MDDHGDQATGSTAERLELVLDAVDVALRFDDEMTLSCLRTLLKLYEVSRGERAGIRTTALARLFYDPEVTTQRTNITRHLAYLRKRDLVTTEIDPNDARGHLNRPTELAARLCEAICNGRVNS